MISTSKEVRFVEMYLFTSVLLYTISEHIAIVHQFYTPYHIILRTNDFGKSHTC